MCHVIKVYCSGLFIKKFNAFDSDLCIFLHLIRLFILFLTTLGLVRFLAFLLRFLIICLHAEFDLIDAALLCRFVNLSRDNLIKTYGCPIIFTQQFSK